MIRLSKRLKAIADLVPDCDSFTDIGTDHGYLPVWLLNESICRRAVAADLRKGPLDTARKNAARYGISGDRIDFVLSDGLASVIPPETGYNVLSITGMGGPLISGILLKGKEAAERYDMYLFSPHTGLSDFRRFLVTNGYEIKDEKHLVDEGKLYVIIKAVSGAAAALDTFPEVYYDFGGFMKEALEDKEVKAGYMRQYHALEALILNKGDIPSGKRKELIHKAGQYKEVLGIED